MIMTCSPPALEQPVGFLFVKWLKEVKLCKGQESTLDQSISFVKVWLYLTLKNQISMVKNNLCILSL